MTELVPLTDADVAAVCGGAVTQTITIRATERNTSTVTQSATATNSGRITATASGMLAVAAAVGAVSSNTAVVSQSNVLLALNILSI